MRVPKTPRVQMIHLGHVQEPTFPCDEGCVAYRCADLQEEVAERVMDGGLEVYARKTWGHGQLLIWTRGVGRAEPEVNWDVPRPAQQRAHLAIDFPRGDLRAPSWTEHHR